MKKLSLFFAIAVFFFSTTQLFAAELTNYQDFELDTLLHGIEKPGAPVITDDYIIFTAAPKYRYVGIVFDFENYKVIHPFEVLTKTNDDETKTPVSEATHQAMLRYFKEYICVGGLPYIVDRFISTNDMNVVWQEQHDIIEEYKDDFGKHLDENENEEIDISLLGRINRVFISPKYAKPLNEVVHEIYNSDVILIGPGSLYTSVIPNLLISEISEALTNTRAKICFILNVMILFNYLYICCQVIIHLQKDYEYYANW